MCDHEACHFTVYLLHTCIEEAECRLPVRDWSVMLLEMHAHVHQWQGHLALHCFFLCLGKSSESRCCTMSELSAASISTSTRSIVAPSAASSASRMVSNTSLLAARKSMTLESSMCTCKPWKCDYASSTKCNPLMLLHQYMPIPPAQGMSAHTSERPSAIRVQQFKIPFQRY